MAIDGEDGHLAVSHAGELAVRREGAEGGLLLGSRHLKHYYRQRYREEDGRTSVQAAGVVARYRQLGIETLRRQEAAVPAAQRRAEKTHAERQGRQMAQRDKRSDKIHNLLKNVPY